MNRIMENEWIKVQSKASGAELTSIILKKDQTEYLWQADPKYWNRHAPILFPIVGKVEGNSYHCEGLTYQMSQHGFARDMDFEVLQHTKDQIVYSLQANDVTKKQYPYIFSLQVSYRLEGKSVWVSYEVKNQDPREMFFSIGAHPGFNCPMEKDEQFEDYDLVFNNVECVNRIFLEDGYITSKEERFLDHENTISLSQELFKEDAIIMKDFSSDKLALRSRKSNKSVTISYAGFPYLGIWSKPSGAPFVCIEPWFGVTSKKDSGTDFKNKQGIQSLQSGEIFHSTFAITVE